MNNVNDIIDMLKDRLVECSRKTSRINKDIDDPDSAPSIPLRSLSKRRSLRHSLEASS